MKNEEKIFDLRKRVSLREVFTTYDDLADREFLFCGWIRNIRNSKNIILILSSVTQNSRALREEIDYGINTCGLPVIVVYPEFKEKEDIAKDNRITQKVKNMWEKLPVFRNSLDKVPTIHVPYKKDLIKKALEDSDFMVNTKGESKIYFFK